MKKVLALLLAMLMVCSIGLTAFAEGEDEPSYPTGGGYVTISNATVGKEYKIYKIFDASFSDTVKAVSYSISSESPFFAKLFGDDGTAENPFFIFTPNSEMSIADDVIVGNVTKRATANDSELIDYLTALIKEMVEANDDKLQMAAAPITATSKEVKFENIPYGYHMIFSTLGTAVTVTSNTPGVTVIDKNQTPGEHFEKWLAVYNDDGSFKEWSKHNTAAIGDVVEYKISFSATNYYKTEPVKYYQVHDEKESALWADFENIVITVTTTTEDGSVTKRLNRGYFISLCENKQDHSYFLDNPYLGEWGSETPDPSNAEWYLVLTSEDTFRFTIPWMKNHKLSNDTGIPALSFENEEVSDHASVVNVEILYKAAILPTAVEGLGLNNMANTAHLSWVTENYAPSTVERSVDTDTFGLGLLKEDATTRENLAGAEFRIYYDEACTEPVYIIPTNIEGVYVVDSLDSPGTDIYGVPTEETVSGRDARSIYSAYLTDYLNGKERDNYMITPVNGKVVVRGLDADTYYLRESKAPSGYNPLSSTIAITIGGDTSPFQIFADLETGEVANIREATSEFSLINYHVVSTDVANSRGVELPSTGGEGAMILITIGFVVATAFAVLLITQKKMAIYKD